MKLRFWTPGKEWTTVAKGRVWYHEDDEKITVCALLSGAWGGTVFPEAGTWDDDVDQLWIVELSKSTTHMLGGGARFEIDPVEYKVWEIAYIELGNKPHRAIGYAMRDGQFLSRVPVTDLAGVRQCEYRLIWYETPADRRAVRLTAQARVKREEAQRRRRKRLRWRLERGEWQKHPRRYNRVQRRRDARDARW